MSKESSNVYLRILAGLMKEETQELVHQEKTLLESGLLKNGHIKKNTLHKTSTQGLKADKEGP